MAEADEDTQRYGSADEPTAPPEQPSAMWTRRLVILAFWAVVVCLGLPHWTWTTSIERSSLPLESMSHWADGQACQFRYPLTIGISAKELNTEAESALAAQVESLLNNRAQESLHSFIARVDHTERHDLDVALSLKDASTQPQARLQSWKPVLDVVHAQGSIEPIAAYLAQEISNIFEDESASLAYLLHNSPFSASQSGVTSLEQRLKLDSRTTRAFKYASTYHLTFSLFTPRGSPSAWDIAEAIENSIGTLLQPLSIISEYTIDTQVQLYASFSPSVAGPVYEESSNSWVIQPNDLTGFVNAAEWPLSPSIGSGRTINFVLYVPSPAQTPLSIDGSTKTSWIIPQWGGVQIHNLANNDTTRLTAKDLEEDMLVFVDQLTSLLGVPQTPSSLALRISSLTRERATSLILSASSTLGALARLTLKLTSIAIPETVAKSVDETIRHLDLACQDLNAGRFEQALQNARTAEEEVEKAFFEPSMVGQVYFPEEHKVAVYVPLLGPMGVPLLMAGLKELKRFRQRKTKTT